jgi:hypothetical protein
MRWEGHVARMGKEEEAYNLFLGRSEGKTALGRPRLIWFDNIKMDLGTSDLVNELMNVRVP